MLEEEQKLYQTSKEITHKWADMVPQWALKSLIAILIEAKKKNWNDIQIRNKILFTSREVSTMTHSVIRMGAYLIDNNIKVCYLCPERYGCPEYKMKVVK